MAQMNKSMQIAVISRILKSKGIEPDLIDLESYVDESLTLDENMSDILSSVKFLAPSRIGKAPTQDNKKFERYNDAQIVQNLRKIRAKRIDRRVLAKQNFSLSNLSEKNYQKWKSDPNRYDINGIDNNLPID